MMIPVYTVYVSVSFGKGLYMVLINMSFLISGRSACVFWTFSVSLAEQHEAKFRCVCHWFLAHHTDRSNDKKNWGSRQQAVRPYDPQPTAPTHSSLTLAHTDGQRAVPKSISSN